MRSFQESARSIPIIGELDVLVCGGGPAGIAAALASARSGAKTGLVEVHGCLDIPGDVVVPPMKLDQIQAFDGQASQGPVDGRLDVSPF